MNREDILLAIKEIQCRYSIPAFEKDYTDKDYACKQYEKLVLKLLNQLEEKNNNDWFFNILRLMVEKHYTLTDLGLVKIERMKSSDNTFNFGISVNKGLFEDLLSEDEKSMLWMNEEYNKWKEGKINNEL